MSLAATFENGKAYVAKEDGAFFDDGRETALLRHVHAQAHVANSPAAVLQAIDAYARTQKYLMNVGEDKGRIVTSLIHEHKPAVMLECGGYVGYSCILFASALRDAHAQTGVAPRYISLERDPLFAAIIMSLADLAGLRDVVRVVTGPSDAGIVKLHGEGALAGGVDMLFLDHYKPAYTTDLQLMEQLRLIRPGRTVIAADNVIEPGNPPYLAYVRMSVAEKRARVQRGGASEAQEVLAQFQDGTAGQYRKRQGDEVLDLARTGDPELVYESRLVESWEPTGVRDGVEVTRCVGRAEA